MCLSFKIIKQKGKPNLRFVICMLTLNPSPFVLTLAQPQTRGLCMLRNIDLDAARCCTGMGHDTATTPSIKSNVLGGRGQHWDIRFSTATQ